MDYRRKKIIIFSLVFLLLFSCYNPYFLKEENKKIQIKDFIELVNDIPFHGGNEIFISDLKRGLEDFIIERSPFTLVPEGGDLIIGGRLLDYDIIEESITDDPKVKIVIEAYCKDQHNVKNNWIQTFEVSESFSRNKDPFNEEVLRNSLLTSLINKIYNKTINQINENRKHRGDEIIKNRPVVTEYDIIDEENAADTTTGSSSNNSSSATINNNDDNSSNNNNENTSISSITSATYNNESSNNTN
ncbi:hypothetical protein [Blattabacterium cuenoti]|uniref:hypothetical protein n=1 Tax=Blattabacterium cuenoti TaxID=1653831 RepID=UPI00163D3C59|nr:hypothetical protein [Blattabacterium cuenoti]